MQYAWSNPPRPIELNSTGELSYPWEENLEYRDWCANSNWQGAIAQAEKLLEENGLEGWKSLYEPGLPDCETTGFEIVSPILKLEDLQSIQKVCSIFGKLTEFNDSCGLHVHVSIEDHDFDLNHL